MYIVIARIIYISYWIDPVRVRRSQRRRKHDVFNKHRVTCIWVDSPVRRVNHSDPLYGKALTEHRLNEAWAAVVVDGAIVGRIPPGLSLPVDGTLS